MFPEKQRNNSNSLALPCYSSTNSRPIPPPILTLRPQSQCQRNARTLQQITLFRGVGGAPTRNLRFQTRISKLSSSHIHSQSSNFTKNYDNSEANIQGGETRFNSSFQTRISKLFSSYIRSFLSNFLKNHDNSEANIRGECAPARTLLFKQGFSNYSPLISPLFFQISLKIITIQRRTSEEEQRRFPK